MFGIGIPEMLVILAVALIFIGPKKLPELAKSIGRAIVEFKSAATEFKESMEIDTELKGVKKAFDDMNDNIKGTIDVSPEPVKDKDEDSEKTLVMKDEPFEKSPAVSISPYDENHHEEGKQKSEGTLKNEK